MASLRLENITKRFGKITALSLVDLSVEDGEFCVLLGPSGCGKSTLLNIIAGLIHQDEGTVKLDGKAIDELSPRDRDMAMVFQSYALYPHMTVFQNLSFGLKMRRFPKARIRDRVLEAAQLLGIEDLLDRKPRELSGGQRQRVAMGRALVRRPKIFLLDEPLSNLDARLRANVRLELKQLHRQIQSTIVYVTHDQVEAMTLGDKVVVMREGCLQQMEAPETIYKQPANVFVATFIGSPEMNLYDGKIIHQQGKPYFQGKDFKVDLGELNHEMPEGAVQLGVRPEDVDIGDTSATAVKATLQMVSNVGSEKYLHLSLIHETLTLRAPKDAFFKLGQIIPIIIDPHQIHLFFKGDRVF